VFQIEPSNPKALQELIQILEDDPEGSALEAAVALEDVGPRGRDAVPALGKALRHQEGFVRGCAASALGNIGGSESVPFLVFACRDPRLEVRWSAVRGLQNMGAVAAPAVPALIVLLETAESDPPGPLQLTSIKLPTIEALAAIGRPAATAIPALEKVSRNEEPYLHQAAVIALEKIRTAVLGFPPAKAEETSTQTEELASISQIEKCGARITIDKGTSGQSFLVEFWECWPTDVALIQLKRMPHVRSLNLSETRTTDEGLAHLENLTDLQTLDLSQTKITDAGLVHLKGLVQLESLDLSKTNVVGPGLENLAGMHRLRRLIFVGTANESYPPGPKPLDDTALRHLRGLSNLQTLDLLRMSITDAGLSYIGLMKGLESLNLSNGGGAWRRKLDIPNPPYLDDITDAGLAHLCELPALQSLDLTGRSVTDACLEHLKKLRNLKKLILDGTLITEAGVKTLRQTLPKAIIETDMFSDSTSTVAGIEDLGGKVIRNENHPGKPVISIDLSNARISDEDVKEAAKFPQLESLDLSKTEITDAGLEYLKSIKNIQLVNLNTTKVTDAGVLELQKALPNCKIQR
jgi:internalin A